MINMCQGCTSYRTKNIPLIGEVSGCINKNVKLIDFVNASINGKCERRNQ